MSSNEQQHDELRPTPSLRDYIDERVSSGNYGNTSEYLRDLIRRDQEEQAKRRLRNLITVGLDSGIGRPLTETVAAELRKQVLRQTR